MSRHQCSRQKVDTDFGTMYIHIDLDTFARPTGGWISTPGKEPDSEIQKLIDQLAEGLDQALQGWNKDYYNMGKKDER